MREISTVGMRAWGRPQMRKTWQIWYYCCVHPCRRWRYDVEASMIVWVWLCTTAIHTTTLQMSSSARFASTTTSHHCRYCWEIADRSLLHVIYSFNSGVTWVIGARGYCNFAATQKSWDACCSLYHPIFAAPSWLPPGVVRPFRPLAMSLSFKRKSAFDACLLWYMYEYTKCYVGF